MSTIQPVWQHAVAHRLRGHLDPEDLDTACNNPHCTDPGCEGSCMVIGVDGTVLQNLKGPLSPRACKSCWEDPCDCQLLFAEDIGMPCVHCYGDPCRCESADAYGDYWDDDGYTDEYESRIAEACRTGELASMNPEVRAGIL